MMLKPGTRLFSAVCPTELITIRAPASEVDLTIGGASPVTSVAERDVSVGVSPGFGGGCLIGKRYVDGDDTLELLCTKAGEGVPALSGSPLVPKEAKVLPASD